MLVYILFPHIFSFPIPSLFLVSSLGAVQIIGEAFCHIILGASFSFVTFSFDL